jgi:hydrogenase/urease accessory protein HupE
MAHEIGTTRVTVRFPTDDTFRIEVVTDAQALLEKLEALTGTGRPNPAPSLPERLNGVPQPDSRRFVELQHVFLDRVAVRFDADTVRPEVQAVFTPPKDETSPSVATVTMLGHVPTGARQLIWRYGWTFSTYSIEVQKKGGDSRTEWLEGEEDSAPIPLDARLPRASRVSVFRQYLGLGFTHIVPKGLDHILFVLGLFLLSANRRTLLWQVSAFTLAHTLTLGLAMNGIVTARPSIVEPLIALSIAYVAVENVLSARLRPWRVALVFAFGLLHGLGFAGVLGELGLPSGQFVPALLAFNLGVEGGQLTVIAAAALAVGWWGTAPFYRQRIVVPASMVIACVAIYWTAQRLGI